jgi:hypothetical protein
MGDEAAWRTMCARELCAVVTFGAPQRAGGRDRRAWAQDLHLEIGAMRSREAPRSPRRDRGPPGIPPVDELSRLRGHVDGLAPQIAQGPCEGAEAIHQGRALVDQHEVRSPNDAEPTAHCRGRLEGLGAHLDTEALRGLDQFVEELLGVHGCDGTRRTRRGERITRARPGSGGGFDLEQPRPAQGAQGVRRPP